MSVLRLDLRWIATLGSVIALGCYHGVTHEGEGADETSGPSSGTGDSGADDSPDGDGDGDGAGTTGAGTGTDGSADDESGSTTSMPEPSELARGIALTRLEANQGVAITLAEDGVLVPPAQHNAELLHGRSTIVRAYWELDPDFEPRMIDAHLRLVTPEGEEDLVQSRFVDGPPDERSLEGTFTWVLPAASVVPELQFSVGLHEIEGTPPEPFDGIVPRLPAEGEAPLGVPADDMVLKVVFIPLQTSGGGGVQVDAANQQRVEERLLAEYPVQSVEITWRNPWVVDGPLVDQDEGWGILETAREQDDAAPNVYYHLLLDEDSCCANNGQWGFSGIGGLSSDSPNAANWGGRDAMSKVDGNGDWGTGVMVHELGHNHGRPHAPCGGPAGPDPDYPSQGPYTEAGIGVQGYDIVDGELINPFPTDPPQNQWDNPIKDRMSYCWPSWWSDYNWQHLVERTRLLTSWDMALLGEEPGVGLRAFVGADGHTRWSVIRLAAPPEPAPPSDAVVRLWKGALVTAELTPHIVEVSEGGGRFVGLALPPALDGFDRIEARIGGHTIVVPRAEVQHLDRIAQ